jgi:hypothetical protein
MRTLLAAALGLVAFTSASLAEPVVLNDRQMDTLTAGISQNNTLSIVITPDLISLNASSTGTNTISLRGDLIIQVVQSGG